MSRRADSEMVKEMLEKAAPRLTDKGTMLHSDQGVLYRTAGYRELLAEHSMVQSMSRKANCWDNAPMESFFAVLKTECFYNAGELTVDELMKQIGLYRLLQPGALQFEIEKAESCRIQNPAYTERLNRLL